MTYDPRHATEGISDALEDAEFTAYWPTQGDDTPCRFRPTYDNRVPGSFEVELRTEYQGQVIGKYRITVEAI